MSKLWLTEDFKWWKVKFFIWSCFETFTGGRGWVRIGNKANSVQLQFSSIAIANWNWAWLKSCIYLLVLPKHQWKQIFSLGSFPKKAKDVKERRKSESQRLQWSEPIAWTKKKKRKAESWQATGGARIRKAAWANTFHTYWKSAS